MSYSSVNVPWLMRWMTLTTAPSAPATSAATGADQSITSQMAAPTPSTAATAAMPTKYDDLRLAVRRLVVVLLGAVERLLLPLERFGVLRLVVGASRIDEAEQMRGAGHHELQADHLAHAGQHRLRLHRELVAAMQLGRDLRRSCVAQSDSRWKVEIGLAHGSRRFLCVSATALSTCEHQ